MPGGVNSHAYGILSRRCGPAGRGEGAVRIQCVSGNIVAAGIGHEQGVAGR